MPDLSKYGPALVPNCGFFVCVIEIGITPKIMANSGKSLISGSRLAAAKYPNSKRNVIIDKVVYRRLRFRRRIMILFRQRWFWAICMVIVLLGVVGCSSGVDQSGQEKERIDETLWQWKQAKNMATKVLDEYDSSDSVTFGQELLGALGKMEEAKDELSDLASETEDQKLGKNAKLCSKGMDTVNKAIREYGGVLQVFLGSMESGSEEQVKQAQVAAGDKHKQYLKDLKKGRDMINRSGL
jgi:hypothetical protein